MPSQTVTHACALLAIGSAMVASAAPAQNDQLRPPTAELLSHRAVYKVSLVRAEQQDGMRGADGTLTYTLVDRCTGYTIESRLEADFGFANGLTNVVRQHYAGWESHDGRGASFRMQAFENDMLEDAYRGRVEIDAAGIGRVTYQGSGSANYELPKGTLVSTRQIAALIRAARNGERFFAHVVVDGSLSDGPYRVSGVIGQERRGSESVSTVAASTDAGAYWPVTLAYFPLNSSNETPVYEVSLQLRADGIVNRMIQDFGAYALSFEPETIAPISGAGC